MGTLRHRLRHLFQVGVNEVAGTGQSNSGVHSQSQTRHLNITSYIFSIFQVRKYEIAKSYFEFSNSFKYICNFFPQ